MEKIRRFGIRETMLIIKNELQNCALVWQSSAQVLSWLEFKLEGDHQIFLDLKS